MSDEHLLIEQLGEVEARITQYQMLEQSDDVAELSYYEDTIEVMREHQKRLEQALEDYHH